MAARSTESCGHLLIRMLPYLLNIMFSDNERMLCDFCFHCCCSSWLFKFNFTINEYMQYLSPFSGIGFLLAAMQASQSQYGETREKQELMSQSLYPWMKCFRFSFWNLNFISRPASLFVISVWPIYFRLHLHNT